LNNYVDCALYGVGVIMAFWQWRRGLASIRIPVAATFLLGVSLFLLSQNTQTHGLPLAAVIAFLLYENLWRYRQHAGIGPLLPQLSALLLIPLLAVVTMLASLMTYHSAANPPRTLFVVPQTRLQGLLIPPEKATAGANLAQYSYINTLLEAAALFTNGSYPEGRIQLFDRINPLPFMLGFPPPKGGYLWWEPTAPFPPAEELLGNADYVLVPKMPTSRQLPEAAMAHYRDYLTLHFVQRENSANWILFSRHSVAAQGK